MLLFLIGNLMADEAVTTTAAQPSTLTSLLPFVLIFFVFYFLMIRPQKKKFDQEQTMLKALQKGDEVFTKAGILGTIYGMTEKVVTLEVSEGVKMKVLRSQVGGLANSLLAEKKDITKTA
ncbi:MAG: preprotein translocase subunit YajC [Bacteriovoracaceae bacterium]|nr:preprotein translocase subunit YajC [Bacteriovoracaceae bacterium]